MDWSGTRPNPLPPVKGAWHRLGVVTVLFIGACASPADGWHQAGKTEADVRTDYRACASQAESATLDAIGVDRAEYGAAATANPSPFDRRGDNPMALADRSQDNRLYKRLLDRCMLSKGYRQGDGM